jgi:hypothetical protein
MLLGQIECEMAVKSRCGAVVGANQFPDGSVSRCGPAPFHGALLSSTIFGEVVPNRE